MKCDIIIPIWNRLDDTMACLRHVSENTSYPYRLILIDNGSEKAVREFLEGFKTRNAAEIKLIRNEENAGFVKATNQGLKASSAPYVCVLNNDTLPAKGWLGHLVEFAELHKDVGLLNPLPSGHEAHGMTLNQYAEHISANRDKYMEMNQCQGFCMLIKRELIDKIGYLDERFGLGGFDDTDYSMRAHKAGYKCVSVHSSYVYHREHHSFDSLGDRKKIQCSSETEYFKKWPRHLRIAIAYVMREAADKEISSLLDGALLLAREWCWVNLWVLGGKTAAGRITKVMDAMGFPLHQNIKISYLNKGARFFEVGLRILERSFGSKRRKKYDIVITNDNTLAIALDTLKFLQGYKVAKTDFSELPEGKLAKILEGVRTGHAEDQDSSSYKCDIILPVCDQYEFTKKCIESIIKNTDTPYRLIVINNGKNANTKSLLDKLGKNRSVESTILHNNHNIGWVKALNKGIELSRAPYVCFQNDDTIVTPGWLRKMISILRESDSFGAINPTWEGRPKGIPCDKYNSILEKKFSGKYVETDWCRGFSAVFKKAVIERIGKVDEMFGLAYYDDVDYSVRAIEAGKRCLRAMDTYVWHHRNVTAFKVLRDEKWTELHERNKLLYHRKWGRPLRIVIILSKKIYTDDEKLQKLEDTVFYLARKQHHVDIWGPYSLKNRFLHTNVRKKIYHPLILKSILALDLYLNGRKRPEKRYDAVFRYDSEKGNFDKFVKDTADNMKEKSKEEAYAEV